MCESPSDHALLAERLREQQHAIADLAIERRGDKESIALLRLQLAELEARAGRYQYARDLRTAELEQMEIRLNRILGTARGAQRELARIHTERAGTTRT